MSEHTPRSYGDMVMGKYLKGLAEIAKEHPSKIEQLEALEKAATGGPWTEWIGNTSVHFGVRIETNVPWMLSGADGVVCQCDNMDSEFKRQAVQDAAFIAAARNAMPHLLAVAKAAKLYLSECREQNPCPCPILRKDYRDKLIAALSRLEAQ